jgi:hypothetical protein
MRTKVVAVALLMASVSLVLQACESSGPSPDEARAQLCDETSPRSVVSLPAALSEEELAGYRQQAEALRDADAIADAERLEQATELVAEDDVEISALLDGHVPRSERLEIEQTLDSHGVEEWRYVSPAEALAEFKATFPKRPELWENLELGDIPASYRVRVPFPSFDEVEEALDELDATEDVRAGGGALARARLRAAVYDICDRPIPRILRRFLDNYDKRAG